MTAVYRSRSRATAATSSGVARGRMCVAVEQAVVRKVVVATLDNGIIWSSSRVSYARTLAVAQVARTCIPTAFRICAAALGQRDLAQLHACFAYHHVLRLVADVVWHTYM